MRQLEADAEQTPDPTSATTPSPTDVLELEMQASRDELEAAQRRFDEISRGAAGCTGPEYTIQGKRVSPDDPRVIQAANQAVGIVADGAPKVMALCTSDAAVTAYWQMPGR